MKKTILIFYLGLILVDLRAQSVTDTLDIIYRSFNLSELDKSLFKNKSNEVYAVILAEYEKGMPPFGLVTRTPRQEKYNDLNIYFCNRAYLVGFKVDYWIVVDELKFRKDKSGIVFRLVTSEDNWLWQKDRTIQKFFLSFKKKKGGWQMVRKKVL
ncbi:MAG: hypothetical protein ACKO96_39485 [Flammeovirgaceae bacterium]